MRSGKGGVCAGGGGRYLDVVFDADLPHHVHHQGLGHNIVHPGLEALLLDLLMVVPGHSHNVATRQPFVFLILPDALGGLHPCEA